MANDLRIEPLDAADDQQLAAFHEVGRRSETEDGRPWNEFWSLPDLASRLREQTADKQVSGLCAVQEGEVVGMGLLELGLLDNLDKGWIFVAVAPERRGRGVGATLLEALVDRVRAAGRREVLMEAVVPFGGLEGSAALRFAERHGFRHHNTEVVRLLRLPLHEGLLDELAAETAGHHDGYSIETYVDDLPDRYLASYCRVHNQLAADAPTGDVAFEAGKVTPDVQLAKLERAKRAGRTTFIALAVHDGEAVGYSELFCRPALERAFQMGTLVRRDHRGHRLGMAMKAANLAFLQQARPDVTVVDTQNAESNDWMVAINVRLGFEAVGLAPAFVRRLD